MNDYKFLCEAIEQDLKHEYKAPSDFKWLSKKIEERTHEYISHTTLMRLWGYLPGGSPRTVTLDILARFLGYMGYDDFCQQLHATSQPEDGRDETAKAELHKGNKENVGWRQNKWLIGFAAAGVLLVTGILLWNLWSKPSSAPIFLTSLDQISPNKQYHIYSRQQKRGALGITDSRLGNTWEKAHEYQADTISTFAILLYKGAYYLYNVTDRRFINASGDETDAPNYGFSTAMDIYIRDSSFVFDFCSHKGPMTLNLTAHTYGNWNGYNICCRDT